VNAPPGPASRQAFIEFCEVIGENTGVGRLEPLEDYRIGVGGVPVFERNADLEGQSRVNPEDWTQTSSSTERERTIGVRHLVHEKPGDDCPEEQAYHDFKACVTMQGGSRPPDKNGKKDRRESDPRSEGP